VQVRFAPELYHSPPLPWVQAEAEGGRLSKIETLMLVGHNPWWEMAAEELTDRSVVLKTASALLMESELDVGASWEDALRAQWTIDKLIHPRELMFTEQD
jgi:phosphohistidine phosphatase SixA